MARPSEYNIEIGDKICSIISTTSKSLRTICSEDGMPDVSTIMRWIRNHEQFREQYARAKEEQADYLIEEMIDIADDSSNDFMIVKGFPVEDKEVTNRSRLRVDTRKWIASKLKPKKYGDKVDVTSAGEKIQSIQVEVIRKDATEDTNK